MGQDDAADRRRSWDHFLYAKWPYIALAVGVGALAIGAHDTARQCHRDVMSTAKAIDQSLPTDVTVTRVKLERLTHAADLCGRGEIAQATHILQDLGDAPPHE